MEAVGQLAGGVAHDFNNLLTIINGYSELLLRASPGDPIRDLIERDQQGRGAGRQADPPTPGVQPPAGAGPASLDLNAVVADTEKMLRRLIGEDIDLATRLARSCGRVKADPGQIEQVIA